MIQVNYNGRPFSAKDFEDDVLGAVLQAVVAEMREKIGSIRDPETGEFPVVSFRGGLRDLRCEVEGSPALLRLVEERMELKSDDEEAHMTNEDAGPRSAPRVFLSHASEDDALAGTIAAALQRNGIETWYDGWSLSPGDSLRRKIDEGLAGCTHFVVLLTAKSIKKRWVNIEMDAALVQHVKREATFIPLRYRLSTDKLPPTLSGMYSPQLKDVDKDIMQLVHDIHGVSKKPPIGAVPSLVREAHAQQTGLSPAATALAKHLVETSETGQSFDPQVELSQLEAILGLSEEDLGDAIYELRDRVKEDFGTLRAEASLFAAFDQHWMPWNPADDAKRIAADMVGDDDYPTTPSDIASRYGWVARRLNPALTYLIERDLIESLDDMDTGDWVAGRIDKTDKTRRYVKGRPAA